MSTASATGATGPSTATPAYDVTTRRVGRRGLNPTLVRIILGQAMRDRGALVFAVVMPVFFFLMFGRNGQYADLPYGRATVGAYIMTGMALYGVLVSTISAGTAVSVERTTGWTRQLRLTPLAPSAYIAVRCLGGMLYGALSLLTVYVIGFATGVRMPADLWVTTGLVAWAAGALFAACGLFLGYLFRSSNAMKIVGPGISLLAFLGGLFVPLDQLGEVFQAIAPWTPMYGVHQLSLAPYAGEDFPTMGLVNAVAWLVIFLGGAAWLMSRDTGRV